MWVRIPPQPQRSTQDVERGLYRMENLNFGLYITYIALAVYMIFAVYKSCLNAIKTGYCILAKQYIDNQHCEDFDKDLKLVMDAEKKILSIKRMIIAMLLIIVELSLFTLIYFGINPKEIWLCIIKLLVNEILIIAITGYFWGEYANKIEAMGYEYLLNFGVATEELKILKLASELYSKNSLLAKHQDFDVTFGFDPNFSHITYIITGRAQSILCTENKEIGIEEKDFEYFLTIQHHYSDELAYQKILEIREASDVSKADYYDLDNWKTAEEMEHNLDIFKLGLIVIYLNIVVVVFGGLMVSGYENIGFAGYMIGISIPIIFGCISKVRTNKINRAATLRLCKSYMEKSEAIETRS